MKKFVPVRYDNNTKEDDSFFYGETWETGELRDIFITHWMRAKGRIYKTEESIDRIKPVKIEYIKAERRRWLERLTPEQVAKELVRLQKEGYDLYGETYNDLTGEEN